MHPLKTYAKRGVALFMLLGITSGIGAIQHGNNPTMSFQLAGYSFVVLMLLNLPTSDRTSGTDNEDDDLGN